jgi:hypothetical protein
MCGLLLYIRLSGVLLVVYPSLGRIIGLSVSTALAASPAAPVRRNPGAVGPAGQNAIWSASTYAFGRPPFSFQYRRNRLTIFPWTRTRSGPKIRVS